jgi:uncharacterized membrane protein YfcA
MKLSRRAVTAYGFVLIAVLLAMLGVTVFGQLSPETKRGIFFVGLILLLLRIAMRMILQRQERMEREDRRKSEI